MLIRLICLLMVQVLGGRYPFSAWIDVVCEILRRGRAGSEELRDMCLDGAAHQWEHGESIKKSIATVLLVP